MLETYNIFVYGTLKEGFPNFKVNTGVRLAGDFVTKSLHALYIVGERHSPWMVADEVNGVQATGQVFTVDKQGMQAMDKLERTHEENGYKRVQIEAINTADQAKLPVFVYLKQQNQLLAAQVSSQLLHEYTQKEATKYLSLSAGG